MRNALPVVYFLTVLVSLFCAFPANAQQRAGDQGIWIRDNLSKCEVWAPSWATRSSINGTCVNGKAEGIASISLFLETAITDLYDGYFLSGYYIAPQKVDGLVTDAPIGKLFELPMGIDRLKVYTLLQPRTKRSSACNDTIYAALNIQQVPLTGDNPRRVAEAILQRYQTLCASFGQDGSYPTLTVQFVPFTFFTQTTPPVYARVSAAWQENAWRVIASETTELLGTPQRQNFAPQVAAPTAAATGRSQPLELSLSAFVSSSSALGYPTCTANLRLANRGRVDLSGVTIIGTVYTTARQPIANFRASRDNALPVNAQITIRSNLPAAACPFIGLLQVASISCVVGTQTVADCKPFVRFIGDDTTQIAAAANGMTLIPNVQILY